MKSVNLKLQKLQLQMLSVCLIVIMLNRPPGVDNLDIKFLRIVANLMVCHIINLSIEQCICPQAWKTAKGIPLSKNPKGQAGFLLSK